MFVSNRKFNRSNGNTVAGLVLATVVTLGLSACQPATTATTEASAKPLLVKAYTLPAGQERNIASSVERLFNDKKSKANAAAELLPNNQLLIYADEYIHASVAATLAGLAPMPADKATQVTGEYWFVVGKPQSAGAESTELAGTLAPLQTVLGEINQQFGAQQFRLLERLQLRGAERSPLSIKGARFDVRQTITATAPQLMSTVQVSQSMSSVRGSQSRVMSGNYNLLDTELLADSSDQWLVVGSSALPESPDEFLYIIARYRY